MGRRLRNLFKWLYPGMRVKRWVVLVLAGSLLVAAGVDLALLWRLLDFAEAFSGFVNRVFGVVITREAFSTITYAVVIGVPVAVLGVLCIFVGLQQVLRSITSVLNPEVKEPMVDVIRRRRHLAQGCSAVVNGGGTG